MRKIVAVAARLPFALCVFMLALTWAAGGQAEQFQVCAFGFNSYEELAAIRSQLPPEDFEFVDFSAHIVGAQKAQFGELTQSAISGQATGNGIPSWLLNLCRPDIHCDVIIFSGEFAGRFFGRYESSSGVQEMEEASCQQRCQGLFHQAQEVFLLACNTLATKDLDSRTPQEYLQVLLSHDFDRASAERVVELRYGPLGPSFRESFGRIFMGVPRIYGFSSVAPNGQWTASLLRRYFHSKGDYGRYLRSASGSVDTNTALLTTFKGTSLMQVSGVPASRAQITDRELRCAIYDHSRSVGARLRIIRQLLTRSDFLSFLPSIEVFFRRYPPPQFTGEEQLTFVQIQKNEVARAQVIELVDKLDVSVLKLELAYLARQLDWISADRFRRVVVDDARRLLNRAVTTDVVDVMCDITTRQSMSGDFQLEDLPEEVFRQAEGLRLAACLSPIDERVTPRLAGALASDDVWARRWAAYALSKRLPLDDTTLKTAARHLDDPSEDVRQRLQWLFKTQRPLSDSVRMAVRARDPQLAAALAP